MRYLLPLLLLVSTAVGEAGATPDEEVLAVIAPPDFAGRPPSAQELTLIFKRKKLIWDDGYRLQPVNLPSDHAWRRLFSQRVMKSLPEAQAQYWNGMYYHGVYPPHVVASAEAMLRYVSETRGALGYVGACEVDARVKPLLWLLPSGQVSDTPPELHCAP